MITETKNYFLTLQNEITSCLAAETHASFKADPWTYHDAGGGISMICENNPIIEKAGVNFSHIMGKQLPQAATEKRPDLHHGGFQALGVSVVIHPHNPFAPTTHANLRFICVDHPEKPIWWFGGGFDLTPYYGFMEDCVHWHKEAKLACAPLGADIYQRFKKNCDDYFFLPHRQEPRGIGGLFFDDLNDRGFAETFAFIKRVGKHFLQAYIPILKKRKDHPFNEKQRQFQAYRRGRYVEFNLLFDRGTLFGIQSNGRTESILMSLPPSVIWQYDWHPEKGSAEAELYEKFLVVRDWI